MSSGNNVSPDRQIVPDYHPANVSGENLRSHVLIVDDQELLRDVVGEYLTLQGYLVQAADCGTAAIGLLKAGLRPNLMLCDVILPDLRGNSFAREARLLVPDLKVLFMSGHFHENVVSEIGDAEFLQKPFPLDVLARRVRNLITGSLRL